MDNAVGGECGMRWSQYDVMGMCGLNVLKECLILPLAYNSLFKEKGQNSHHEYLYKYIHTHAAHETHTHHSHAQPSLPLPPLTHTHILPSSSHGSLQSSRPPPFSATSMLGLRVRAIFPPFLFHFCFLEP